MVKTPDGQCSQYETLKKVDALEWELRQLDGVETTNTLALLNRRVLAGLNEGNPKWYEFLPNQDMLNTVTAGAPRGLYNDACSLLTRVRLPARPQGRDADARGRPCRGLRRAPTTRAT